MQAEWERGSAGSRLAGNAKHPTLYMLVGQNAFDECTAFHEEHELQIDEAVTRLISEHKILPIIVVGIDSSSNRNYEYSPYRDPMADQQAKNRVGKESPIVRPELSKFRIMVAEATYHERIGC
ncbi:MAG: hypothetical protein ABSD72_17425 [Terracidiphilus sp.]